MGILRYPIKGIEISVRKRRDERRKKTVRRFKWTGIVQQLIGVL